MRPSRSRVSRCWALRSVAIRQTPLGSLRQVGQGRQGRDPGGRPPFLGDPQNPLLVQCSMIWIKQADFVFGPQPNSGSPKAGESFNDLAPVRLGSGSATD